MFGGGTLAASADYSTFVPSNMTGVYAFDAFETFAGGAVIDTAGKSVTIPAAIRKPTGQSVVSIALAAQGAGYIGEPYVLIEGDGVGASAVGTKVQAAWSELDVAQCGYCQAGQIMSASALLAEKPKPTDADIDEAMAGNICRCATYTRIRAAIKLASGQKTEA